MTGEGTGALNATAAAAGANPDAASGLDDAAVAARVKAGLVNEAPPAPVAVAARRKGFGIA